MLTTGTVLGRRYEIQSKIGAGGMSDVYKANDRKLNRKVSIKILKRDFADDQNFVTKFRNEARAAASLNHPNIVNVYDVGEGDGIYYIVMEHIDGITLKKYIEYKKKLNIRESIEIAMQVARGLEAAHSKKIIHRDIKPQNIMISRDGKVKVTDFGIARAASAQTISSNAMGSVHYISPEQAKGGYCDERSDIYSLGITLYEMLTGKVPFEGESTVAVALQHIQGEIVPPRKVDPMIPVSLEKIILKCTQKRPDRRYSNVTELIEDLKKCLTMPNGDFVKPVTLMSSDETQVFTNSEVDQLKSQTASIRQEEEAYQMGLDEDSAQTQYDSYEDSLADTDSSFEKIVTFIMIGVVALIAVIGVSIGMRACGILNLGASSSSVVMQDPNSLTMINLLGTSVNDAESALKDMNLSLRITEYASSEEYDNGKIFYQSVPEGESIERSSVIEVKVSTGSNRTVISNVSGMSEKDARRTLYKSGFNNVSQTTTMSFSDTVAPGKVMGTNPEIGVSVDRDSEIVLIISAGPETDSLHVPDLSGKRSSKAEDLLSEEGLTLGKTIQEASDSVTEGRIIRTVPEAGASVPKGSTVDVYVSAGSGTVKVPNVTYVPLSDATAYLKEYGLQLGEVTYEKVTDTSMVGLVVRQSVKNKSIVEKGTVVDLVVGQ
ncbi:MAG: Stk1 family PASTA domain-containing Ser/Thr kinase [Lachnospiraceae bacterium]|nr:Stk1 family PASTA domain-containing Ser/Thr kinase [Lachnospiraceae bacterium]